MAADENEEEQDLFIDGDRNRKMVKTEILTKKLAQVLGRTFGGGRKMRDKRSAGKIFLDFVPLARIVVESGELYRTRLN